MTNSNPKKGIPWRFGSDWPGQRCGAKTRKGTPCQRPAYKRNGRCSLHGGRSTGPKDRGWPGARPVEWLLANHDVGENWCLIHATHITDGETTDVAKSSAVVGLCPITEVNLGDGPFKGPQYLASKGRFGVGSDSNVGISLVEELRT